jgi:hypothetical protein
MIRDIHPGSDPGPEPCFLHPGSRGQGTGTMFLITKFLITKFLITKFLSNKFPKAPDLGSGTLITNTNNNLNTHLLELGHDIEEHANLPDSWLLGQVQLVVLPAVLPIRIQLSQTQRIRIYKSGKVKMVLKKGKLKNLHVLEGRRPILKLKHPL